VLDTVLARLGHYPARRFAMLAALLLLAAQTVAVQHVHAEPVETFCTICASTAHDDSLLPASQPVLVENSDDETPVLPPHPAARQTSTPPTLARAPPTA